jgi:hypothetical protein
MVLNNRRNSFAIFAISIVMLEMVLISEHIKPANGWLKKKKIKYILKKGVVAISLLHLLHHKKKVKILPLPVPL